MESSDGRSTFFSLMGNIDDSVSSGFVVNMTCKKIAPLPPSNNHNSTNRISLFIEKLIIIHINITENKDKICP